MENSAASIRFLAKDRARVDEELGTYQRDYETTYDGWIEYEWYNVPNGLTDEFVALAEEIVFRAWCGQSAGSWDEESFVSLPGKFARSLESAVGGLLVRVREDGTIAAKDQEEVRRYVSIWNEIRERLGYGKRAP